MEMSAGKLGLLAILGVLIASLILVVGCAGQKETQILKDIPPGEAHAMIQNNKENQSFVILDVRTPQEYAEGRIENSFIIDFYSPTFKDELDRLDKSKTYLIYCRTGNRSGKTLPVMKKLGFKEVYNMSGGIVQWEAEGLPTVK
jgi:rhodanese-related sulfurtransferase